MNILRAATTICTFLHILLPFTAGRIDFHQSRSVAEFGKAEQAFGPSSLTEWTEPGYGPDYFRFANVKIVGTELFYYVDKDSSKQFQLPGQIEMNSLESVITINVTKVPADAGTICDNQFHFPAVLIAGTPWDSNLYEMISNNIMPLWATAKLEGLLDPERYLNTSEPPEPGDAPFILIQARREGFESPWSYMFNYMSQDQKLLDEVSGSCFSDLTVISTSILRFLMQPWIEDHHLRVRFEAKQRHLLQEFRKWLFLVESLHQRQQGLPKPAKLTDSAPYSRPRVLFSSRPVRIGAQSRGVTNEPEVVAFIEEQYDVNVTVVNFGGPLENAINLVQSSSLLLGMHGAGLTNLFWLKPGSHFLQLAPYGWEHADGTSLIRGGYFETAAVALGCTASHWINPHPHKAVFHKWDFEDLDEEYFEKPDYNTPKPVDWNPAKYWIYQSTEIDLESFAPALDHAMRMINIPKKPLTLPIKTGMT